MSCFKCRLYVVSDTCSYSPISFALTVGSTCSFFHSLDPVLAFATWMRLRGTAADPHFSKMKEVGGRTRLYEAEPMSPVLLVSALRRFYKPCGVLDARQLATHTAKQSGVHFYEAVHQTPAWIMEKGGWTDAQSFMKYRSLCNRPEQRYAFTHTVSWY